MKRILLAWFVLTTVSVSAVWAQKTVTGTVTARDDGSPVPGVNVIVKGSTIGTVTDIEGRYQISVPDNSTVLVYSFIGLATEEVTVGTQTVIDMVMTADIRQLTEVVVTAIGLESDKASLGYSIQAVNADEIVNARETNIVNALNSKAAGVMVVSASGSPGASALIRIRGASSISRSNQPLFIVDGMPIDNSGGINAIDGVDNSNRAIDLNPNDIASLTVLKGPAATALYGIRAANGAIIVTTKRGGKGMKVEFSGAYTANQVNKLPEMQTSYAQGRPVNGVPTWRGPDTTEGFSWGPAIADLEFDGSEYDFDKNGRLVPKGTGNGNPPSDMIPMITFLSPAAPTMPTSRSRAAMKMPTITFRPVLSIRPVWCPRPTSAVIPSCPRFRPNSPRAWRPACSSTTSTPAATASSGAPTSPA
jgi:TonB-dependent SusC/RagA subfamily outer membrane receptor